MQARKSAKNAVRLSTSKECKEIVGLLPGHDLFWLGFVDEILQPLHSAGLDRFKTLLLSEFRHELLTLYRAAFFGHTLS